MFTFDLRGNSTVDISSKLPAISTIKTCLQIQFHNDITVFSKTDFTVSIHDGNSNIKTLEQLCKQREIFYHCVRLTFATHQEDY